MTTRNLFAGTVLLALLVSQACNPIYYSPNTQNVPLLAGKGDYSIGVTGNGNRGELQAAYAASDHFGLGLAGGFVKQKDNDNGDGGSGGFGEVQAGYFTNFSENFVFETYGLLGFGNVENHFASSIAGNPGTNGEIDAKLLRLGIQPAIGFRSRFFEAAVSSRLVSLNYSNPSGSLVFDQIVQTDYLDDNKSLWLLEPALTLRGGTDFLKFQIQFSHSFNLTNSDFRQDDDQLLIGIVYRPKRL